MALFFRDFESLGQYHDFWSVVLLFAPDAFHDIEGKPVDQRAALDEAFEVLRAGFIFVQRKVKDTRLQQILREMIEMSYQTYEQGEAKLGASILQECEGIIWPSRAVRLKHVVEAERRAFGDVVSYARVQPSRHPFEGRYSDLTTLDVRLCHEANARCREFFGRREDFAPFVLIIDSSSACSQLKSLSWKKTKEEVLRLVAKGECVGFVRAEVVGSGRSGLLVLTVETPGRPQISVRSLVEDFICQPARYHFDVPRVLSLDPSPIHQSQTF